MPRRKKVVPVVMMTAAIAALLSWDAPVAQAASCGGTQGTALLLGCDNNTATETTSLSGSAGAVDGLFVNETGAATIGLSSFATSVGVFGLGGGGGSVAINNATFGVIGTAGTYGVYGSGATGAYGTSSTGCSLFGCGKGVSGTNTSTGYGVLGSSTNGIGVGASSGSGTALAVTGKAKFSRSGLLSVPAGVSHATVTGVSLTTSSLVLATVQSTSGGTFVKQAVPNVAGSSFTVYLNKAPSVAVPVAWFVVN